ncbi:MAG: response regulator [Deltaproteobacteria bacterium]|nr:response regulator [Deltaproteobacteria bacterium]MBW2691153.1 response regulator [Deltaproteobacteria bacterium]
MAETNDTYRELFENSPDAILIIEEERFVDCNPAAARMMGFPSKQALLERYSGGQKEGTLRAHPSEFSPPIQPDGRDSFEKAEAMMQIVIEQGSHCFEWDHLRADGEVFSVEVMLTAVDRGPKHVIHVVWRDIAERKKLEQKLRQSQRLESVGRLAGGIAHDFNNLLLVILSHAETLREELAAAGQHEKTEAAAEICKAGERAAALTRQLLTFSRGQPVKRRPTDLVEVMKGLRTLLERLIGEDIIIEAQLPLGPVTVVVDTSQIEQLIVNLATNGRDAMPEGGRLEVALLEHRHERSNSMPRLPTGDYAVIRVSDTGEGMEQEQIDRAFDPFYTTKEPGAGSGLGLATVHSIAEQCGGGTYIESTVDKGTSVSVLIPLSDARPVSEPQRSPTSETLDGDETILLVEDEDGIRKLMRTLLQQRGYRVINASDGVDALDIARKYESLIDLVITDVVMPRLSGPELVKRLQKERPGFKVIFMSGYAQNGTLDMTSACEDAEVLEKPFSHRVLLSLVRKLLDGA